MVVYFEYVLIDNFIIDYLLLKATFLITGETRSKSRLFLCAFLGCIFSLTYPLIEKIYLLSVLFKISCGLLLLLLCGGYRSKKDFVFNSLVFFGLTFVFLGCVVAIKSLLKIPDDSEFLVATIFIPIYFIYKLAVYLVKYIYSKKHITKFLYKTEIIFDKKSFEFIGFLDSGNGVYYEDKPVIFCDKKTAQKLIQYIDVKTMKKIKIQTVNGIDIKNAFTTHLIKIYDGDKQYIYNDIIICFSGGFNLNYDLILHPKLFEVENDENSFEIKKTS